MDTVIAILYFTIMALLFNIAVRQEVAIEKNKCKRKSEEELQ